MIRVIVLVRQTTWIRNDGIVVTVSNQNSSVQLTIQLTAFQEPQHFHLIESPSCSGRCNRFRSKRVTLKRSQNCQLAKGKGAQTVNRTQDLQIFSLTLSQLSYQGLFACEWEGHLQESKHD